MNEILAESSLGSNIRRVFGLRHHTRMESGWGYKRMSTEFGLVRRLGKKRICIFTQRPKHEVECGSS